jgi:diadenosine tetraphosphate (Ap4A) HIT family hydrolase
MKCPFCNPFADEVIAKNELCYARWDRFPVSKGHLLVIPIRHITDYFSLTEEEKQALFALIDECKEVIEENFRPAGYNIGFNVGEAAGQTVMHCHCHVIPRYSGDTENPRGGIRGVIPNKKEYNQSNH